MNHIKVVLLGIGRVALPFPDHYKTQHRLQYYRNGIGKPEGQCIKAQTVKAPKKVNKNPSKNKTIGKTTGVFITEFLYNLNGDDQTSTEPCHNTYTFKYMFRNVLYYIHGLKLLR